MARLEISDQMIKLHHNEMHISFGCHIKILEHRVKGEICIHTKLCGLRKHVQIAPIVVEYLEEHTDFCVEA